RAATEEPASKDSGVRRHSGPSASSGVHEAPARGGTSLTFAFVLSVGLAVAVAAAAAGVLSYVLARNAAAVGMDGVGTSAALNEAAGAGVRWEPQGPSSMLRGVTMQPARVSRRGETVAGVVYRAMARDETGRDREFDVVVDSSMS